MWHKRMSMKYLYISYLWDSIVTQFIRKEEKIWRITKKIGQMQYA